MGKDQSIDTVAGQRTDRLVHLDMLRGVAALLVCVGHLRGFVVLDFSALPDPQIWQYGFYALTGLGHQAVIVFFALSGYLVGGQALRQIKANNWHFGRYMVRRFARLWVVAIPALLLTLLWDNIGVLWGGGAGYQGTWSDKMASGPLPGYGVDHSFSAFLGNVAFLQTITVPVFGNNGPLWSLANEFWYYLLFPFVFFTVLSQGSGLPRLCTAVAAVLITWFLPWPILVLGTIWIGGAGAALFSGWVATRGAATVWTGATAFAAAAAIVALISHSQSGLVADLMLGLMCAGLLPFIASLPPFGRFYAKVSFVLSEISYTLYVVHFPFLSAIIFSFVLPQQWEPGSTSISIMVVLLFATLIYAAAIWWCFERNTIAIRRYVQRIFHLQDR